MNACNRDQTTETEKQCMVIIIMNLFPYLALGLPRFLSSDYNLFNAPLHSRVSTTDAAAKLHSCRWRPNQKPFPAHQTP